MKKIIRTDVKRMLSVFLATLILLTAWVFVAPENAGAVTSSGTYTYRVYINCTNSYTGKNGYYQVSGKPNNGTGTQADIYKGTSGSLGCGSGSIFDNGKSAYYPSSSGASASSFPTYFYVYTYKDSGPASTGKTDGAFSAELQLYVNGSWTTVASGSSGTQSGHTAIAAGGSTGSSHFPQLNTVTIDESPSNVTIPTSGTATTNFKAHATDQYGVRIASAATGYSSSATITSNTGVTIPKQTTTDAADYWKPSVTNDAKMTGNTNEKELSVYATFSFNGVTKTTDTKKFTITDPQYNYLFDENGGAKLLYDNNGVATEVAKVNIGDDVYKYGYKTYYGNSASDAGAKIPTDGYRVGHEFIAMYNSAKAISYAATKPEAGTTSGYTGQLKSSDEMNYTGKTYYAAWWAKDVNVTYINNDGTVLKTSAAGKYDQKADYTTASAAPANPQYVYAPGPSHGTYEYEFDHWEVVQAKQYDNSSNNNQSEYNALVGEKYNTATLKGDTTFQAIYRIKGNTPTKYTITYNNGTETTSNANFNYKDDGYKTATYPATADESKTYTYTFLGWAEQVNSNDTVYFQDWDEDAGAYIPQNNAQTPLTDYKVYSSKTWVAVYGRKYIDYTVTFNFVGVTTDETGATVYDASNQIVYTKHYNDTIEIPAPESYTGGKLSGTAPTGVTYSNAIGNTYSFNGWSGGTPSTTVTASGTFTATYTASPANYTIKFVDYDGTVLYEGTFEHGTSVTPAKQTADANVTQTWRDDNNEYTFTGWAPAYASTATDNVTYTAQYAATPLYTVTYMDESGELATWRGTTAENIPYNPADLGIDTPTRGGDEHKDEYATDYAFSGWATTEYVRESPVTPEITSTRNMKVPEGGTTVYAQFTRTPIIYTINFIYGTPDETGTMPDHKQNLEYGQEVTIPTGNTLKRDDDNTFHYDFANWDKVPSATVNDQIEFVYPGEDHPTLTNPTATYTANYRKSYVYYDVTWLYQNGDKVDGKDFRVEKYIYGERIRAPFTEPAIRTMDRSVDPLLPELGENCTYVFDQWVLAKKVGDNWVAQRDANNALIPFNASTYIEAGVEYGYLPTYKSVADVKTLTILDEDGTVLGTKQIGFGETILDKVESPEAKNPDDDSHYVFDKWVNVATDAVVTATDTMTGDITIKAVYKSEAHTYKFFETKTAPTFDAAGEVTLVCEADGCGHTKDVEIPALQDTVLPDIRLYVKNAHWDSTVPTTLTAIDGVDSIPVAPNSLLIANGADKAEASTYYIKKDGTAVKEALGDGDAAAEYFTVEYNTALTGSQVTEIWAYYTEKGTAYTLEGLANVANATSENPDGWHKLFDKSETPGEANHSDVFASFEPAIEDGKEYIVYLKAVDAKGNVNYVSSAPVAYDNTAPVVTLTSENGSNAVAATETTPAVEGTKFCLDATITVEEAGLTVLLDGTAITMSESNTYAVTSAGKHTVRVTDAAGNVTAKAFEIVGEHKTAERYKAATCTEAGWKKDICTLCGKAIGEGETYDALGHALTHHEAVEATCAKEGRIEYWSCARCNKLFKDADATIEVAKNELSIEKISTHVWNEGKITKQANCTQNGIIVYTCTLCGVTEEINGDVLDVTVDGYDADTAAAILVAHPDLAILGEPHQTTDPVTGQPILDPETGDPVYTADPVQATDTFGNPAYVQKTDPSTGAPLFTETPATDENGKTIYNNDGTPAYLPDYTDTPIYSYTIVHNYNVHSWKADKQLIAPTCTENGVVTHECRYCGLKFYVKDVDALGHDFTADEADETAWTVGQAATCTTDGYKYPTKCARCDAENTEKVGQVVIPATGHAYTEDPAKSVAPAKDPETNTWITMDVFIGEYYIDDDGNMIDDEHKIGEVKTVFGYTYKVCDHDPHHIKVIEANPEVEYTYTFISEGATVYTATKNPGDTITAEEIPTVTKASTPKANYTFEAWLDGDGNEVTFPMDVEPATGDMTFTASFKEETIYYTVTFYEEDGTEEFSVKGYQKYEAEFDQLVGPEKAQDATYVYTFDGWVALDAGDDATPVTHFTVTGNASYKAHYTKTLRTYKVFWVIDGEVKKSQEGVAAGTLLSTLEKPADPANKYDDSYHYVFNGWSPALTTAVESDVRVVAQYNKVAHHFVLDKDIAESCTEPAIKRYKCSDCDYFYEVKTGKALGHNFDEEHPIEYVAPTPEADGYKTLKCTRCDEIVTIPLTFYAIKLKITVKNTDGAAVAGARVSVYDGDRFIDSDITSSDGVAVVYVPEAKDYRIVIEGAEFSAVSGTITVNENGRITGGSVPTPRAVHACTCTCHKDGLWPTIFRFFHKVIKFMTGKYHCCADPDPRY